MLFSTSEFVQPAKNARTHRQLQLHWLFLTFSAAAFWAEIRLGKLRTLIARKAMYHINMESHYYGLLHSINYAHHLSYLRHVVRFISVWSSKFLWMRNNHPWAYTDIFAVSFPLWHVRIVINQLPYSRQLCWHFFLGMNPRALWGDICKDGFHTQQLIS